MPLPLPRGLRVEVALALALVTSSCREEAPASSIDPAPPVPTSAAPDVVGRAGPVQMTLVDFRTAIDEARILQHWRTGEPPPVEALRSPMLRRRVLSKALETRVIRDECGRRGLAVPPDRLERALESFAAGRPLEAPSAEAPPDPGTLDARLAARYDTAPERARQVAIDLLYAGLLADALLAEVPEARVRQAWEDDETQVRVELVQVPRVPSSAEIDAAVKSRAADITAFYEKNQERFRKPERALARRVVVPVAEGAPAADREAARQRALALHARVAGGEPLARVAAAESIPSEQRREGLVGPFTRAQAPEMFEGDVGALSPVLPHRLGWVFQQVETRVPASVRPADDEGVRREIAAELLRTEDALPHAREVAERVRHLLQTEPGGTELPAIARIEHLRRETTPLFARASRDRVPGIGLAPELFDAVFRLTDAAPVTAVLAVRQHYVVARRIDFRAPDPAAWLAARDAFTAQWKGRERPFVVDRWLSERLRNEPLWVDGDRIDALDLADLGVGAAELVVKPR